ncbi:hypothetical protein SCEN_K01120 [Saccharomyces cerevisiae]|uniref:Putative uncharacterized protein YKL118W n=2 Tax=Saccharomyces cerevisiae TaxID=4932 RepID=YKL8_YEAST|nr:RecName: Full=Putative uncharacterized protein YKL118W [Saccharomyces cerevisiae S288C]AAT93361.1 YKL118W [Saccharomyces cerevisiae]CAY80973.1 EC1118_1K5_1156p [Saccharomyces cerevisiae EC1118]QHB09881.1 hypothetical protein SCEN_K01120 [Saccharomyces cerevisiae]CAA81959.1 unnamed protein product [Saccharomyces cerevisiae]CAI7208403.1 BEM_collapsed_G0033470.mRNA.1.CDS.1 [Saccharomyces cerevisiae]
MSSSIPSFDFALFLNFRRNSVILSFSLISNIRVLLCDANRQLSYLTFSSFLSAFSCEICFIFASSFLILNIHTSVMSTLSQLNTQDFCKTEYFVNNIIVRIQS